MAITAVDTQRVVVREMSKFSMRERRSLINEIMLVGKGAVVLVSVDTRGGGVGDGRFEPVLSESRLSSRFGRIGEKVIFRWIYQ